MEINWKLIDSEIKGIKLTNKKMAELLGIGIATWNRYRTGVSDIPLKLFYKVLEILNLKFDDVIIDTEQSNNTVELENRKWLNVINDIIKEPNAQNVIVMYQSIDGEIKAYRLSRKNNISVISNDLELNPIGVKKILEGVELNGSIWKSNIYYKNLGDDKQKRYLIVYEEDWKEYSIQKRRNRIQKIIGRDIPEIGGCNFEL